ncbi:MAG: hypothetical protein M3N47_00840 [Chloroflexota bacterium]|nr:hypothetical protein [Chloroflexota bacterium]
MADDFNQPWGPVRTEVARFVQDLPKLLLFSAAVGIAGLAWRVIAGDALAEAALFATAVFGVMVVAAPVFWVARWRRNPERHEIGSMLRVLALAAAWCALVLGILLAVLASMDALGAQQPVHR